MVFKKKSALKIIIAAGFLCFAAVLSAQDLFKQGQEAFLNNEPEKAVSLLTPVIEAGETRKEPYLYLGIALQQLERYADAVSVFSRGVEKTTPPYDKLYFNMGNNYFLLERDPDAERAFTRALQENSQMAPAYLNRANTRMRLEKFKEALADYRMYLIQDTQSPQKEVIQELINRLDGYLVQAEMQKQQEEALRAAEEARQRALLESVLSSLQNANEDTVNLRADSEDIESLDMELDIAD